MPGITTVDRVNRLQSIKELLESGKSNSQIAETTGLSIQTIQRNVKYIEELTISDVTPEEKQKKRNELYSELLEAADEAQEQLEVYKEKEKPQAVKLMFGVWMQTIELRMKLYGLEEKSGVDSLTQINNISWASEPDKISSDSGEKIAKILKKEHEKKVK